MSPDGARPSARAALSPFRQAVQDIHNNKSFTHAGISYSLRLIAHGTAQAVFEAVGTDETVDTDLVVKAPLLKRGFDPLPPLERQIAFYRRILDERLIPVTTILNVDTAVAEGAILAHKCHPMKRADYTEAHLATIKELIQECWNRQFPMDITPENFGLDAAGTLTLLDFDPGDEVDDIPFLINRAIEAFAGDDDALKADLTPNMKKRAREGSSSATESI